MNTTPNKSNWLRVTQNSTELFGRSLLVALFLISGLGMITSYEATASYMVSKGVPGIALPVVIALEVLGGTSIIIGLKTRVVAALLAGFTFASGVLADSNFADQAQMIMFLKNVSIAGAFLMLAANGPGTISLDAWLQRRNLFAT